MTQEKEKKPFYKKWWFYLILVLIVVANLNKGEKSLSSDASSKTDKISYLGDTVDAGFFQVTINSINFTNYVGNDIFNAEAQPGSRLAVLNVTFKNTDTEGRTLLDGELLAEHNGKELIYDHTETVLADGFLVLETLNPLTSITGNIVFQVPEELNGPFYYKAPRSNVKIKLVTRPIAETTEAEATQAEVTDAGATQAEVTDAEVTEAEVTEAEVTEAEAPTKAASKPKPSFNCDKASSLIESFICSDAELADLDNKLASSYKREIEQRSGESLNELKSQQRAWLKQRNECKAIDCLKKAYIDRDVELSPWDYETHD